jgi:uncharacterized membrane protein YfcA
MLYFISGASSFFIAIMASMLGLGGSFLFIPIFTWLGLDYKAGVIPTALLLNLVTSLTAQTSYIRKKLTDLRAALIMSAAAIIFAQVGAYINRYMQAETLMLIFAILIAAAAMDIIFLSKPENENYAGDDFQVNIMLMIFAGAFAGIMSGLLGIGGGFVIMPILLFLGYPPKPAVATSSMVVFFSSTSALLGHLNTQDIDLMFALICVICVTFGAKTGAILMTERFRSKTIKQFFGIVMVLIAIKFFFDAL